MKYLVALTFCLAFVAVSALTKEEIKERLKSAHEKCQADSHTAVDAEALKAFKESKGKGTVPENMDVHNLCISKTLKWQNADGTVNKDLVRERVTAHVTDASKVDEIVNECAVEKENEMATAKHLFECFYKHHDVAIHEH